MKKLIIITAATIAMFLTGCGHNINVQGWGIACPYGAMGYGTFSCVKDNVKVKSKEEVTKDGIITSSMEFTVEDQVTGYDVELKKAEAAPKK